MTALGDRNASDADEGRLARWARLKRDGGADPEEETLAEARRARVPEPQDAVQTEPMSWQTYRAPEPLTMPGGVRVRDVVPAMPPLAPDDDNDDNAEGIEAPPPEALAMLAGEAAHHPDDSIGGGAGLGWDEDDERPLTPEETEAVAGLPAIESLTDESDFHPFMATNIPEFIRRRALRVLFRSHPLLTFRDGLNDYDEDFNVIDTLINALTDTSYDPEKGHPGPEPEPELETESEVESESELESAPKTEPEAAEAEAEIEVEPDADDAEKFRDGI